MSEDEVKDNREKPNESTKAVTMSLLMAKPKEPMTRTIMTRSGDGEGDESDDEEGTWELQTKSRADCSILLVSHCYFLHETPQQYFRHYFILHRAYEA